MRAKKVFDPSDNNIPKKRGRPVGSLNKTTLEKQLVKLPDGDSRPESRSSLNGREQGGVCSVCHNNKKNSNERLVSCRECSNKAHVNCLNGDDMMLKMYPDNTWQCPHCKTCCVCFETSDAGDLVVCSVCADAYHRGCHEPQNIDITQSGNKWLCINCQMPAQLQVAEIHPNVTSSDVFTHRGSEPDLQDKDPSSSDSSISEDSNRNSPSPSPTPPTLSPQPSAMSMAHSPPDIKGNLSDSQSYKDLDVDELIDPSIPDAKDWTAEEVYNYFSQYFPDEAIVFKEQEIDGSSLLLMKRMDVISSLKLKLGTALKIYRHVVKLQFRRDDPKLYWL
uniref:PHD-type domain-containing protein n=1 Tax=Photinus pyralis TaxID=7054 RepID=A0A1Y1M3B8_PHOPY